MLADETQTWQLLRDCDDPDHLEFPADYRQDRANARFNQLAGGLDAAFGGRCLIDRGQDASFHGRIDIPIVASATGRQLTVVISNFGDLAVLAVDNPGVWDDAETAELLHPVDANRIHRALDELGYTLIREDPLWEPYDGTVMYLREHAAKWWERYFDYL
ncbi:hypothetical protein [Micromonospora avicenniae]|uniref:Uncharacterized protein n=1 Tax=Micromonospora avicenniae TaxID=1198245 RepID=A0A1N6W5H6_9ACTN|nr:hypothetical protein [Micromonospora avicenniae]SIQ85196.1 hypothetical protein SAMN05444858_104363 [Micromonospora avicenniae]